MKKINIYEYKNILIELLEYITNVCDEYNIKYSLIGGSLIGAIRDKGIIPWDDDIDIILMPKEYEKLIKILKKKDSNYLLLQEGDSGYSYPFSKLIDKRTCLIENGQNCIENYGAYLDIFKYRYVSNFKVIRIIQYYFTILLRMLIGNSSQTKNRIKEEKNFVKRIRNRIAIIIGNERLVKIYIHLYNKNHKKTKYILSNWPVYGFKKEIQKSKNMSEYISVDFENIVSMITKNYDKILKTTFGDYMTPPPIEKRVSHHNMVAYWRDDEDEKENKK